MSSGSVSQVKLLGGRKGDFNQLAAAMPSTTTSTGSKKRTLDQISNEANNGKNTALAVPANGRIKPEVFQADREVFLQAIEKPTQIYRYLRLRMCAAPTFLQRNLSYRLHFSKKKEKKLPKKKFHPDDLLKKVQEAKALNDVKEANQSKIKFLNFVLTGIKDCDNIWADDSVVRIEFKIGRACERKVKRKDKGQRTGRLHVVFEEVRELFIRKDPLSECPCVSVPASVFTTENGDIVSELHLFIQATLLRSALICENHTDINGTTDKANRSKNGKEKSKSVKSSLHPRNGIVSGNATGAISATRNSVDSEDLAPRLKKPRVEEAYYNDGNVTGQHSEKVSLVGHLTLLDKNIELKMEDADYELMLKVPFIEKKNKRLGASWETLPSKHLKVQGIVGTDQEAVKDPRAKLNISLRTASSCAHFSVPRPPPICSRNSLVVANGDHLEAKKLPDERTDHKPVVYQFLYYNNNSRQQTEAHDDLRCPWCSLNCWNLYSLLKHLKLCHPRFHFIYMPCNEVHRIDVSINKNFDGSYSGSAFDLVAQPPGEAFSRNGPTKRTYIYSMLVCHPKRSKPNMQEFLENDEDRETDQRRTYVTGHNRLYHHTSTCLPIHPKEIDVDSEGEYDPEWLRIKTSMMIDEFTDVNEGEKELMKMWNLHVLKYNYVGDCQIPLACNRFVELKGKEIIMKNLYRNFVVHLTSMFDFNLLDAKCFFATIQLLHKQMKDNNTGGTLRNFWTLSSQNLKPS